MRCPCTSGEIYEMCCGRFIAAVGVAFPPTAEALMRSRFTAFATGNTAYLLYTWEPSCRPADLELDPGQQWYRLDILSTQQGGPFDTVGIVAFCAYYRYDGAREQQRETSRFSKVGKQWFYLDAV